MNRTAIIGLVLGGLIGLGTYLTDGDVGMALKTAFDKDATKAACVKLLDAEPEAKIDTTE